MSHQTPNILRSACSLQKRNLFKAIEILKAKLEKERLRKSRDHSFHFSGAGASSGSDPDLAAQLGRATDDLNRRDADNADLRRRIRELELELAGEGGSGGGGSPHKSLQAALEREVGKRRAAEKKVTSLTSQLDAALASADADKSLRVSGRASDADTIAALRAEIEERKEKRAVLKNEYRRLQSQHEAAIQTSEDLERRFEALTSELASAQDEIARLREGAAAGRGGGGSLMEHAILRTINSPAGAPRGAGGIPQEIKDRYNGAMAVVVLGYS